MAIAQSLGRQSLTRNVQLAQHLFQGADPPLEGGVHGNDPALLVQWNIWYSQFPNIRLRNIILPSSTIE
ncbi:hypothetical protein ACIBKZ_08895 [Streptomyces sp. NPDC050421]|uniref:hypothetical protein n=1 Tax=Streptomyces sp. NPDC050421 TaxID=3365613 RepID=UPI0037978469